VLSSSFSKQMRQNEIGGDKATGKEAEYRNQGRQLKVY
jgi:hypothetical protein